ncbi:hypothetical protein [Silvibacterium acidisoli]|uniref:hypothetical protein n=1 Tax=Acidobacteriaceae bacterium ZG23-2 TaxID=2883246 RepID=UPI00406D3776
MGSMIYSSAFKICRSLALASTTLVALPAAHLAAQQQAASPSNRVVGAVTAIDGRSITIKTDSGASSTLTAGDSARVLRMAPGAKTLAGATPIQLTDLAIGDRILAVTTPGSDGTSLTATTIIAMKQADIAEKQNADRADWQKRGVGGLVKSVDPAAQTIVVTAGSRLLTIHTSTKTVIRRYDPNSIEFSAAKPSSFDQIHPGDQLRARGDRGPDGSDLTAEEIVAGSFRNIAATVVSVDAAANTVQVTDLATKKPVSIHINSDSQLHKLPPEMAQGLAARLKRASGSGSSGGAQEPGASTGAENHASGERGQRNGDLSQMLQRTPVITASDLHKGDAVMIVATQGTPSETTAVTLLAGVEPVLASSSSASESVFSASWSGIGGGGAGADAGTP